MKIETELNIGDVVFVVSNDNKVEQHVVDYIKVYSNSIVYKCGRNYTNMYSEDSGDLFVLRKDAENEAIKRHAEAIKESV